MAKFAIKFTMDDLEVIDDVAAIFPDDAVGPMIATCERQGHIDADGYLIKGGRAVTYAVRKYLTGLVKDFADGVAAAAAMEAAKAQVNALLSTITIEENNPVIPPPPQPEEEP